MCGRCRTCAKELLMETLARIAPDASDPRTAPDGAAA
jgi:bacterioferritin-associated ferredoxin